MNRKPREITRATPNKNPTGRPSIPRPCANNCGRTATASMHLMVRGIGPGQSTTKRRIRCGTSLLLCSVCGPRLTQYADQLEAAAKEAITYVVAPRQNPGPRLFAEELPGADPRHELEAAAYA